MIIYIYIMYGVNVSQINQSKSSVLINIPVSDRNDSNFRVLSSELVYLNDLYLSYRGVVCSGMAMKMILSNKFLFGSEK